MKFQKTYSLIIVASILLAGSSCSMLKKSGNDTMTLQYKMEQGNIVAVKTNTTSKIEMEQMGQNITVDMESNSLLVNKALSVDNGEMNIELTFKDMFQKVASPMGDQETDYSELKGKTASFKLKSDGSVSDKKGFTDLPELTAATGETISGEMYEQVVNGLFFKLPDHAVKTGDTWTDQDESDMPYAGGNLKTKSSTVYTIGEKMEVDGQKCVKILLAGETKTDGNLTQNGMDMSMSRTATSTGHYIFSLEKGMYLSMQIDSKTNGIIDIPAAGMQIPQTITNTVSGTVSFE